MSGNTFTLTVGEGSSIDVGITLVVDTTYLDHMKFYVATVRLRTTLSAPTTPYPRLFKIKVTQPTSPPTGYVSTNAVSSIPLNNPATAPATFAAAGSGPFDGTYGFTQVPASLIAEQFIQPKNVSFPTKLTLQTSLDNGSSWTDVPFTGTGTNYLFDIGDGTNRTYDTKGADSPGVPIVNGAATLYFKQDYNTTWPSAQLNTDGTSPVTIGGDTYDALHDSAGTLVTAGNDFTLYVPNSNNTDNQVNDPLNPAMVQDLQTQVVATIEYNLMDLGLVTAGTVGGTFQNGTNGSSISKTTERGEDISFYALLPWSQVTVDRILDATNAVLQVNDTTTPTYYAIFRYQGTDYTFSFATDASTGKRNIKLNASTSRGATTTVTINRMYIRPGTPDGGTKAL